MTECVCGHDVDDHEDSFLAPCLVDDCDCDAYDESDESDWDV